MSGSPPSRARRPSRPSFDAQPVEFRAPIGHNGGAVMNMVDLAIVIVIALGVFIGWRNGLIGPLLAEGTFLVSYWIGSTHPGLGSALVPSGDPRADATPVLPIVPRLAGGVVGRH